MLVEEDLQQPLSSSPPNTRMGYDIERFTQTINDGLLCCICKDVLEDPLQAPCEHAYCAVCIHGWLVHENVCPEDRRPLWATELRPLFRYMKNDLDRLQIKCKNFRAGCTHVSNLEYADNHERDCGYQSVQCPSIGCTVSLEKQNLEQHLENCSFKTHECPKGCGLPILSTEDEEHNCVAELRTALELLRSEMICKIEEQRQETEMRLDTQRRHVVQRDNTFQAQINTVKEEVTRLVEEIKTIKISEEQHKKDIEKLRNEKHDLVNKLKNVDGDSQCPHCDMCPRRIKITTL